MVSTRGQTLLADFNSLFNIDDWLEGDNKYTITSDHGDWIVVAGYDMNCKMCSASIWLRHLTWLDEHEVWVFEPSKYCVTIERHLRSYY